MTRLLAIDFEWYRCPDGYKFGTEKESFDRFFEKYPPVYDPDTPDRLSVRIDGGGPKPDAKDPRQIEYARQVKESAARACNVDLASRKPYQIVPKSKERISYRPLDGHGSLVKIFAKVRTPEDLLRFTARYGPLKSSDMGESIKGDLDSARQFRELLSCKLKGPKKVAAVFEAQSQEKRIAAWCGMAPPPKATWKDLKVSIGAIDLVSDPARGVRLRLTTESLLGAIWWELNQKLVGETTFRVCRQCGNPFEAGPGGDARADATFCRHECSALFHSLRRSKGA